MLQKALSGIDNLPPNANAFDLAKSLISATAGIPGAERYVSTLFQTLLPQLRGRNVGLTPGTFGEANQQQAGSNLSPEQPQGAGIVGAGGQFQRSGGYLTPPMNPEELNAFAQNYTLGDPTKLAEGYAIGQKQNEAAQGALADIEARARTLGVSDKELPYFLQMAQQSPEKNPQKLLTNTMLDLEQIRALDNAFVPEFGRGPKLPALGLVGTLLTGDRGKREPALKKIQTNIDNLVAKGFEPIVRDKLAKMGLSRTEIEERIHPFTPEVLSKIESFPKASKDLLKNENILEDFITKNVPKGISLLALRHKLWKEKGYDWNQVVRALDKAVSKGLPLSKSQSTELTEFSTQPPRDSILDFFKDWGRPFDILSGRK